MFRFPSSSTFALLPLAVLLVACSATKPTAFGAGGGGGSGGGSDASGASSSGGDLFDAGMGGSTGSSGNSGSNCASDAGSIYTITADNQLYRFDPPTLAFTLIGTLSCSGGGFGSSPYSMSVDRSGVAWVIFTDGHLFKVDTKTATCAPTSFAPGQSGFTTFGMGFSANSPGSNDETLFVSDSAAGSGSTEGLAKIDTKTLTLTPVGAYDAFNARAEMTGTGDARLFGAFEGTPYVVAEIQKTNAHILSQAPQNAISYAPGSSNFAFAFWGGDFWLFVGPGTSTDVFHYVPATKVTTKVKTVGFEIVGAGVSTCAPLMMPK